ncbi:hypothetical protein PAHAL_2G189300 [Panicum hallii]|uniref:Uncharacterized protein n=1 Tax=Panicum hallii TaxID=206008 RepID=A0A2T8KPJ7_9POAL|nr:hypothetical protein PAHAL_2G189300 [Panicum hallii]
MPTPFLPEVVPVYQSLKPEPSTSFAFWPFHLACRTLPVTPRAQPLRPRLRPRRAAASHRPSAPPPHDAPPPAPFGSRGPYWCWLSLAYRWARAFRRLPAPRAAADCAQRPDTGAAAHLCRHPTAPHQPAPTAPTRLPRREWQGHRHQLQQAAAIAQLTQVGTMLRNFPQVRRLLRWMGFEEDAYYWKQMGKAMLCTYTLWRCLALE